MRRQRNLLTWWTRKGRVTVALSAAALLAGAGCTEARRPKRKPPEQATAAPVPPASPTVTAPAPAATGFPATPAAPPAAALPAKVVPKGLAAESVKGTANVTLSLPKPVRLGGFAFTATYDPALFLVADPVSSPALGGYLCQANVAVPGTVRFNCAGLPDSDRSGLLATFPVQFAARPPSAADFTISDNDVVDDLGARLTGTTLELAVGGAPAP